MVNPRKKTTAAKKEEWLLISDLADKTTYKKGYLSLMARQGKLKAKKYNNNWYSTLENLKMFETEKKQIRVQRNDHLRRLYREKSAVSITRPAATVKAGPTSKVKVKMVKDNIFDEVQKELEEVLGEIREKQRKLKRGFGAYRETVKAMPENIVEKERKETEDLSEKLIMDLGKLINTANEVQEGKSGVELDKDYEIKSGDMFSIPVKRISKNEEADRNEKAFDLDRRNLVSKVGDEDIDRSKIAPIEKDNFLNESYNYFPFEREERSEGLDDGDKTNRILIAIIAILLLVAAGLIYLILGF